VEKNVGKETRKQTKSQGLRGERSSTKKKQSRLGPRCQRNWSTGKILCGKEAQKMWKVLTGGKRSEKNEEFN